MHKSIKISGKRKHQEIFHNNNPTTLSYFYMEFECDARKKLKEKHLNDRRLQEKNLPSFQKT